MPSSVRKSSKDYSSSRSTPPSKFIPNMAQLQKAIKELPDPELWSEPTCSTSIFVDKQQKFLEFVRKRIQRGELRPYRWIYEGKILIRNRDA